MRVGCLADLHGYLPKIEPGQLDLLLIAGDVGVTTGAVLESFPGYSRLLLELADWLEDVDCPVVGVAGNHDFGFEGRFGEAIARDLPWTYLCDETVEIEGLKIHGSPWTPTFGGWAFMQNEPDLAPHWDIIPDDVEILITHGPPRGLMDVGYGGIHAGSKTLDRRLIEMYPHRPGLHIFGHIHSGRGVLSRTDGTVSANVSYVDEDYRPLTMMEFEYDGVEWREVTT